MTRNQTPTTTCPPSSSQTHTYTAQDQGGACLHCLRPALTSFWNCLLEPVKHQQCEGACKAQNALCFRSFAKRPDMLIQPCSQPASQPASRPSKPSRGREGDVPSGVSGSLFLLSRSVFLGTRPIVLSMPPSPSGDYGLMASVAYSSLHGCQREREGYMPDLHNGLRQRARKRAIPMNLWSDRVQQDGATLASLHAHCPPQKQFANPPTTSS